MGDHFPKLVPQQTSTVNLIPEYLQKRKLTLVFGLAPPDEEWLADDLLNRRGGPKSSSASRFTTACLSKSKPENIIKYTEKSLLQLCENLHLRRTATQTNLEHVVPYLKIINTFFEQVVSAFWSKSSEKLKNGNWTFKSPTLLELLIKTAFFMFWSITQELLGLLKL